MIQGGENEANVQEQFRAQRKRRELSQDTPLAGMDELLVEAHVRLTEVEPLDDPWPSIHN